MKKQLRNNSGGALLFAIVAAFLISFLGATLSILTLNQSKIIYREGDRIQAANYLRSGMLYVHNLIQQGMKPPFRIEDWNGMDIDVTIDPERLSEYKIEVFTRY